MTVTLPSDLDQFLQSEIAAGRYSSLNEALCNAVRLLRRVSEEEERLRGEIAVGLDDLARGDVLEISSDKALHDYFEETKRRRRSALEAKRKAT